MILAFETSCDDTCAALVGLDGTILANVISSQEIHDRFGGVVPEIAARHHLELIDAVVAEAFATISRVTSRRRTSRRRRSSRRSCR
jgi:N6-L-threonylcarbamoyladenine synthase